MAMLTGHTNYVVGVTGSSSAERKPAGFVHVHQAGTNSTYTRQPRQQTGPPYRSQAEWSMFTDPRKRPVGEACRRGEEKNLYYSYASLRPHYAVLRLYCAPMHQASLVGNSNPPSSFPRLKQNNQSTNTKQR